MVGKIVACILLNEDSKVVFNIHRYHHMNRLQGPQALSIRIFDIFVALVASLILLPIWLVNIIMAMRYRDSLIEHRFVRDDLGRGTVLQSCKHGWLRHSLCWLDVIAGRLSLCGIEMHDSLKDPLTKRATSLCVGLYSLYGLHRRVGLIDQTAEQAIDYHERHNGLGLHLGIFLKSLVCAMLYGAPKQFCPSKFHLFGLCINNVTVQEALAAVTKNTAAGCKRMFFVNVNSINQSNKNPALKRAINQADIKLVDGSGVRMAARMKGIALKDNVNGTDFLPHLCRLMERNCQSVYLLGADKGIAEQAAFQIKTAFPGVRIAGYHHGYFASTDTATVIEIINNSGADFLLVAMGSPHQELWIEANAASLNVHYAIAVGGLFDFVAGKIPRAPHWMRELGLEWIYRLMQEPRAKFSRYVIGNPQFILQCWLEKLRSYSH